MREIKALSENTKQFFENYNQILDEMDTSVQDVTPTENISETYILQMLPHHEAGIKLSENILSYTTNPEIELLAKSIVSSNQNSLEDLLIPCENLTNTEKDNALYNRKFKLAFDSMLKKMQNVEANNNLNKAYLSSILYHSEGGIAFAKNVISFDICPELKEYVKKYITKTIIQTQAIKNLIRKQN